MSFGGGFSIPYSRAFSAVQATDRYKALVGGSFTSRQQGIIFLRKVGRIQEASVRGWLLKGKDRDPRGSKMYPVLIR